MNLRKFLVLYPVWNNYFPHSYDFNKKKYENILCHPVLTVVYILYGHVHLQTDKIVYGNMKLQVLDMLIVLQSSLS